MIESMSQCLHHGLKVLVLRVDGDTATVAAACYGAWEVAVADLEPLDPPHHDQQNGREENEESTRSYRAEQRRKRAEEQAAWDEGREGHA